MQLGVDFCCPPFFVQPMPYNTNGEAPEMDSLKQAGVDYEVWDSLILYTASFPTWELAHRHAGFLNCENE